MRHCFLGRWICLPVSERFHLVWKCRLFDYSTYIQFCVHWHGGQCLLQLISIQKKRDNFLGKKIRSKSCNFFKNRYLCLTTNQWVHMSFKIFFENLQTTIFDLLRKFEGSKLKKSFPSDIVKNRFFNQFESLIYHWLIKLIFSLP